MDLELTALHGIDGQRPTERRNADPTINLDRVNRSLEGADAQEVLHWVKERFGDRVAVSSSFGADSALMLHLVTRVMPNIPVVFIDTGYLFPETYRFAEQLRERFRLNLLTYSAPMTPARQEALYGRLWEQGEEGVRQYLALNKVEPMKRALEELGIDVWLAGLRASQTDHRRSLRKVALHDGRLKVHPILDWGKEQVDEYLSRHALPRHPLYSQGYRSIGDWHSTSPVAPDEDDRAGRLLGVKKECGLHLTSEENSSLSSSGL